MTPSRESYTIVLEGEWDIARRDELSKVFEDALASCASNTTIVVDLRTTTFVDSSALAILVSLYTRLRGEDRRLITLCSSDGAPRRTIDLLGLGERLGVVESEPADQGDAVA
jgi:anti-anti-sigma factor